MYLKYILSFDKEKKLTTIEKENILFFEMLFYYDFKLCRYIEEKNIFKICVDQSVK